MELMMLMESTDVSFENLESITARLHAERPGIFKGAHFDKFVDMTSYVAKQRHFDKFVAGCAPEDYVARIHHRDTAVATSITCKLYELIDLKKIIVVLLHTPETTWYFETRVLSAMIQSEVKELNVLHVIASSGLMCPLILLLPDYNEILLTPQFATHPNDPTYLTQFENQFRGFLAKSVLSDPRAVMTVTCETCNAQTRSGLMTCDICKSRMCITCKLLGKCSCKPIALQLLANNTTLVETMETILIRHKARAQEETASPKLEAPQFMPTGL